MRLFFLPLLSILFFSSVQACAIRSLSAEERAEEATAIYAGRITSVSLPLLEYTQYQDDSVRGMTRVIRLFVHETVKGVPESVIEAELEWCGSNISDAEPGSFVTLFREADGKWSVESAENL